MTNKLSSLIELANAAAELGPDMNEAQSGGAGRRLLPEGYAFAQLVEVVELGVHPQEFLGQKKAPAAEIQLAFALTGHAKNPEEGGAPIPYANPDGTPHLERLLPINISRNEKAGAFLLFKALNWKGTAKNFAQLLGQKYLIKVHHVPRNKSDPTLVSRLDLKTGVLPPNDPVTGNPYPVPDAPESMFKLFLWDKPTKECWDSLYIEGTWEARDGKPAESKNRMQEKIMSAVNYSGSPVEFMLSGGAVIVMPEMPVKGPKSTPAASKDSGGIKGTAESKKSAQPVLSPVVSISMPTAPVVPNIPVISGPYCSESTPG